MTVAPTFTFLCCKMNVTCSDSSSRESSTSSGYFPKWNLKPQSPVHKRQNESPEEATCLQNSLKAMQGWMGFLHQWKDCWHQDSTPWPHDLGEERSHQKSRHSPGLLFTCTGLPSLVASRVPSQRGPTYPEKPRKMAQVGICVPKVTTGPCDSMEPLFWAQGPPLSSTVAPARPDWSRCPSLHYRSDLSGSGLRYMVWNLSGHWNPGWI